MAGTDLGRRGVRDDPPAGQHHDPVGVLLDLIQVVRGEDDGPAGGGEGAHRGPELAAALHVQRPGRLVQQHDVRVGDGDQGEFQPLGLAPGEPVHPPPGQCAEPGQFQGLGRRQGMRVQAPAQFDQFGHGHARHQPAILQHRGDRTGGHRGPRRAAANPDRPGLRLGQTHQYHDRGRLAGSVLTEQGDGAPTGDFQGDVIDGGQGAVAFGHSTEGDCCVHAPSVWQSGERRVGQAMRSVYSLGCRPVLVSYRSSKMSATVSAP